MSLEQIAGVVGAALTQRREASLRGLQGLDDFRKPVLADTAENPGDVARRLQGFVNALPSMTRNSVKPTSEPGAALGRKKMSEGSTGTGDDWSPGDGADAVRKTVTRAISKNEPGFEGFRGYSVYETLRSLAFLVKDKSIHPDHKGRGIQHAADS